MELTNLRKGNLIDKEKALSTSYQKTINRKNTLTEIFRHRVLIDLGLTKKEVIALYKKQPLSKVQEWKKDEVEKVWEEIVNIRKVILNESLMAIIPTKMEAGTYLEDPFSGLGIRQLERDSYVYHRCIDPSIARNYRDMLDKWARGMEKTGEKTVDVALLSKKEISTINQTITHNTK